MCVPITIRQLFYNLNRFKISVNVEKDKHLNQNEQLCSMIMIIEKNLVDFTNYYKNILLFVINFTC